MEDKLGNIDVICAHVGSGRFCPHCGAPQPDSSDCTAEAAIPEALIASKARVTWSAGLDHVETPTWQSRTAVLISRFRSLHPAYQTSAVVVPVLLLIGMLQFTPDGPGVSAPAAAAPAESSAPLMVEGSMTVVGVHTDLDGTTVTVEDGTCSTSNGYDDVNAGASVTVYNAEGTIVATGTLGTGTGHRETEAGGYYVGVCEFPFSIEVPDSPFYQVEVSHRGRSTVERSGMHDVSLTLGS